jgi:hypothetical protein
MNEEMLESYYRKLADAVDIPIILYNVPKYSGVNMTVLCDKTRHFSCSSNTFKKYIYIYHFQIQYNCYFVDLISQKTLST